MARKASMWAKAAGEYYRKNKGKNGIESFSDVLKSSEFKQEYHAKYGKQGKTMAKKDRKGKGMNNTKRYRGGEGETPPAPLPPAELPSGGATPASSNPVPMNTASSISASPLPPQAPIPPQVVTGGKRKMKGGMTEAEIREKFQINNDLTLTPDEIINVNNAIVNGKGNADPSTNDQLSDVLEEIHKLRESKGGKRKGSKKRRSAKKSSYKLW